MAKQMQESQRKTDTIFRYGGEEIAILCPNLNEKGAYTSSERLRKKIENCTFIYENNEIKTTISIGAAELDENESGEKFITRADEYLYLAKGDKFEIKGKSPRNRIMGRMIEQLVKNKNYDEAFRYATQKP